MKDFWNDRYGRAEYAYGKNPNVFFKEQLDLLPPGKILLPAEGEGRNAVYAAEKDGKHRPMTGLKMPVEKRCNWLRKKR